jgi:hypothetical protein
MGQREIRLRIQWALLLSLLNPLIANCPFGSKWFEWSVGSRRIFEDSPYRRTLIAAKKYPSIRSLADWLVQRLIHSGAVPMFVSRECHAYFVDNRTLSGSA